MQSSTMYDTFMEELFSMCQFLVEAGSIDWDYEAPDEYLNLVDVAVGKAGDVMDMYMILSSHNDNIKA